MTTATTRHLTELNVNLQTDKSEEIRQYLDLVYLLSMVTTTKNPSVAFCTQ